MKRDEAAKFLHQLAKWLEAGELCPYHWLAQLSDVEALLSSPCARGEDDTCPTCGGPVTKIRRTEDLFAHDIGYFDYHTKPCACGEPIAVVKGWIEIPHDLNWIPQSLYTLTGNRAWEPQVPVRVLVFDGLPDEEAKG